MQTAVRVTALCGVLAIGGSVGGCSFPSFTFVAAEATDTGAADAPIDDARSPDARTDAPPDSSADAADSSTLDSALPADSGADVLLDTFDAADTLAADTSPVGRPCSGAHAFCEDFDESTPPPKLGFSVLTASTGSSVGYETSFFASPTRSFFTLLAVGTVGPGGAFGSRLLTAPSLTATTRIDVDLYLDSATYPIESVVFRVQRASNYHGVGLAIDPSGLVLKVDGASSANFPLPSAPPLHKWFHVRLDATLRLTDGSFALYLDDMTTPVLTKDKLSSTDVEETGREAFFGPFVTTDAPDNLRLRFDDIVVDFL